MVLVRRLARVGAAMLLAAACSSKSETPAHDATTTPANQSALTTPTPSACELLTAVDISAIVGRSLIVDSETGGDRSVCRFKPATGSVPSVEVTVDWGGGAAAMTATGLLARREPGITDPLDGIGDQAATIGPALWVRVGEDLLNLTLFGVDDRASTARRIVAVMRPRMGPSAQAKRSGDGETADAGRAGELVAGLLNGLAVANSDSTGARGNDARSSASPNAATADEPLRPATGASIHIPLITGLTLVGAESEPGRGDYEPIVTVTAVTADAVSTTFSSNLPEGTRLAVNRDVRQEDLRMARATYAWYQAGDPPVVAGSTSFSVSSAVHAELTSKGVARVERLASDANPLAAIARLAGGSSTSTPERHRGTLRRVEPHALAFPVLLNDVPSEVPVIHARAEYDDGMIDYYVLDDPANPLLLRVAGQSVGRVVRISYPVPQAATIDDRLAKDGRVAIHGIYFDFGKATLRPESEAALRQMSATLARHPGWMVTIEGHTDNVGGDAGNQTLSQRRAEAVKQALIERYRIDGRVLNATGRGASQPAASNDTLSGRALNRRVELVRLK